MTKRIFYSIFVPFFAACRFGCASCCAMPIGIFWVSGITAIVYGFFGGPAQLETVSWTTTGFGVGLWAIASAWALTVVLRDNDAESCANKKPSTVCRVVGSSEDEHDPMDEVSKFQN